MATPALRDGVFDRSVVLVLEDDEEGSLGVILNRPSSHFVPSDATWRDALAPPDVVFVGGPVRPEHGVALCAGTGSFGPSVLIERVRVGLAADGTEPTRVRYLSGVSGWSPGQLTAEIDDGAWWVVEALLADCFTNRPASLWSEVLRRQPDGLAMMATFPPNPSLN